MGTSLYGYLFFFTSVHVSSCTCMYVYAVLVCVNTCLLQRAYGSQRKPLVVGTCIPSSLRQDLFVAVLPMPGQMVWELPGFPRIYFLSHFSITGITDMCHYACLHKCSCYLNTKPQILMSVPYPLIHLPSSLYNTFELINEERMKKYRSQFYTSQCKYVNHLATIMMREGQSALCVFVGEHNTMLNQNWSNLYMIRIHLQGDMEQERTQEMTSRKNKINAECGNYLIIQWKLRFLQYQRDVGKAKEEEGCEED